MYQIIREWTFWFGTKFSPRTHKKHARAMDAASFSAVAAVVAVISARVASPVLITFSQVQQYPLDTRSFSKLHLGLEPLRVYYRSTP